MKTPTKTFKFLLNNLSLIKTPSQAKQLHAHIIKLKGGGTILSPVFTTIILSLYANHNLLHDCLSLFNAFPSPPPSKAWKSIIRCCASCGDFVGSVNFFKKMMGSGKCPDGNVFPSLLKTCAHLRDLRLGEAVHGCVVRLGLESDLFTGNALMNMYAKLESFDCAGNVFGGCPEPKPLFGFDKDQNVHCSEVGFDKENDSVHENVINELGKEDWKLISEDVVRNQLDDSGEKTLVVGLLKERIKKGFSAADRVRKVFEFMPVRDVVSWNTVIGGYLQNGMYEEALLTVREMGKTNMKPDCYTLSSILPIFSQYVDVMKGKEIHGYAIRHGFNKDVFVGSGLIDMYANCIRLEDSYTVFHLSPQKDSVSWNSMMAVCVQNGKFNHGLKLFREMLLAGIEPVAVSLSSIMPACANLTTLCLGKQLHGYIIRQRFEDNIYISSSLMDMYAKCGNIRIARWIFDKMKSKDTISWTAMLMAYAWHGHANDAILFFEKMKMEGINPNSGSFIAVLTACNHGGLVHEAWKYFQSMTEDYVISPGLEHYSAVSDVLGRSGRLNEAFEFISNMHTEPTTAIWSSLLSACRVHKNVKMAEKVAGEMLRIDPHYESAYVLLSNVYVSAGRWKDAAKLRIAMKKKGMKKQAGYSWVEVKNEVHAFVSGDENHPDYPQIIKALRDLTDWIEVEGYIQDTNVLAA